MLQSYIDDNVRWSTDETNKNNDSGGIHILKVKVPQIIEATRVETDT